MRPLLRQMAGGMRSGSTGLVLLFIVALAGCAEPPPRWEVAASRLSAGLISVWGASAEDVWTVGGVPPGESEALVMRFDGATWNRVSTGARADLWWVHGVPGGTVFLAGADGTILRFKDGAITRMETPGRGLVYGVWGTSEDDVWAVGGFGSSGAFAWRYDGSVWTALELPDGLTDRVSLFKVWGRSADDVWLVGGGATLLHWNGQWLEAADFHPAGPSAADPLFTVHARGGLAAAVGGFSSGLILENPGSGWVNVTPAGTPPLIGVWLTGEGGFAVGHNGVVFRREKGSWREEPLDAPVQETLHAVWADPAGNAWAVGGHILTQPLRNGIILRRVKP